MTDEGDEDDFCSEICEEAEGESQSLHVLDNSGLPANNRDLLKYIRYLLENLKKSDEGDDLTPLLP